MAAVGPTAAEAAAWYAKYKAYYARAHHPPFEHCEPWQVEAYKAMFASCDPNVHLDLAGIAWAHAEGVDKRMLGVVNASGPYEPQSDLWYSWWRGYRPVVYANA